MPKHWFVVANVLCEYFLYVAMQFGVQSGSLVFSDLYFWQGSPISVSLLDSFGHFIVH